MIRINTATIEQIDELYGIGPELAERIVEHRSQHGPFRRPKDLAEVNGVSIDLALILSPQIDWAVPDTAAAKRQIDPTDVFVVVAVLLSMLWFLAGELRGLASMLKSKLLYAGAWVALSMQLSTFFVLLSLSWGAGTLLISSCSRNVAQARRLFRLAVVVSGTSIVFVISLGISNAAYYQFYAPNGWQDLINDPRALAGAASAMTMAFIFGPPLLVLTWPSVAQKPLAHRLGDAGYVMGAPVMAWTIWVNIDRFPITLLLFYGLHGLTMAFFAIQILRSGRSFLSEVMEQLSKASLTSEEGDLRVWQAWLNARLPDPEEQKALMQALVKTYPPSRLRTIGSIIVLGAGGWLFLTACGAIVEWGIQNWLDNLARPD